MTRSACALLAISAVVSLGCPKDEPAVETPVRFELTVTPAGNGAGIVISNPSGIACGTDCSETYDAGTQVVLTAAASVGSEFISWSGGGCSGTADCTITLTAAATITPTFALTQHALTVTPAGNGTGTVTSSPAGIACGSDCSETYDHGTAVVLTAAASPGSDFIGWSGGGCSGTAACTTTITAVSTITATFALTQHALTVLKAGTGSGTVISDLAGIDCGTDCSEAYDLGSTVTLTATADAGSVFTGWSNGCTGTSPCVVTLTAAATVTATFTLSPVEGSISLLEVKVLNPGPSGTFFGQGLLARIAFHQGGDLPAPSMEEQPGSPLGCKAWIYTPAEAAAAWTGIDQGPVQINSPAGSTTALLPACVFAAGSGYVCPHPTTQSTGGVIASGPGGGTATLTDTDVTFNSGNSIGSYVLISGAANPSNNGLFPIVAVAGLNTIVYGNPAVINETIPAAGFHINLAGAGPIPQVADPGFLDNAVSVDFVHTAGGGGDLPAFVSTTGAGSVGDDFVLSPDEVSKLNAVPRDGSAFTVTCSGTECGSGSASGTLLEIVTTDAPTAGLSPFAMPAPVAQRVQIRCAALGSASVSVPAAYSAYIMNSGATRIQTTFMRPTLMGGGPAQVSSISGHAIVGFSN